MKVTSLCFLLRENPLQEILLGLKKRGFGSGRFNGFGGKPFKGESIEQCVLRELEEEAGVVVPPYELQKVAVLSFGHSITKVGTVEVHVFVAKQWKNEPRETEEMIPLWFKLNEIPYDMMWETDQEWVPQIMDIIGSTDFPRDMLVMEK